MTSKMVVLHKILALVLPITMLTSCSVGLSGGSIEKSFSGIKDVTILGPETLEITWSVNGSCNSYKIYQLSSSSNTEVATATIPPARLTKPIIQSDRSYTFAVGCVTSNDITGRGTTKSITTWPQFDGKVNSTLDTTGQYPVVVLSWTPPTSVPILFEIYASQSTVPGDLATWKLTQPSGAGGPYSETPVCTIFSNKIRIGTGGDCNPSGLQAGQIYNFKVVAKYTDGQYSSDQIGNGTSILIPSSFTPPSCILTQAGVGADSSSSYLFLRCDASSGNGACPIANTSIKAYQAINGVRTAVSDVLNGAGTLRIEPQISTNQPNDRSVENLEVEYTCNSTSPATKAIVRYDGTQTAYPKPVLKYASSGYEKVPAKAILEHPSYAGKAMAIGDFNCDGKPDLAIGFPDVTYAQSPYYSKNTETGMVKIYYDYATDASGTITATDTQYLSFRDLPSYSHFGYSVSAGNVNKDVHIDTVLNKVYSCDDLIIGAPSVPWSSNTQPQAFIFYGHPQKFPQPLDSSSLSVNAPTCSGTITNQICSPVRLIAQSQQFFNIDPTFGVEYPVNNSISNTQFGFSVAYIRDFNSDGYGDIAIGDPYCDWDGEVINGKGISYASGFANKLIDVGCVYVYWGGPNGLQNVNVGTTPDQTSPTNLTVPYVKVYPPIPQPYMHFGWSVAGGGDVDGNLPVPALQNGTTDVILANGNDFVVGAPDFNYKHGSQGYSYTGKGLVKTWDLSVEPVDPQVLSPTLGFNTLDTVESSKVTPPWNGAWSPQTGGANPWDNVYSNPIPANSPLANSTGIAFLYRGRAPIKSYDLTIKDGAFKLPNLVTTSPITSPLESLLSWSRRDHQNGSQYLKFTGTYDYTINPVTSFYNCGSRGAPRNRNPGTGYYKHISCLAGRNNFSIIYPMLQSADTPVKGFGTTVGIAGAKEQNAVALYQLGQFVTASAFERTMSSDLVPMSQGNTHDGIRGTSLWEVGIQAFTTPGSVGGSCETYTNSSGSNPQFSSTACPSYVGRLSRSAIREQYSFSATTGFNAPQPDAPIQNDINRDGYADVLVGSIVNGASAYLYTYFGNYAADFSYSRSAGLETYSSGGGCNVNRLSSAVAGDTSGWYTSLPGTIAPYATFWTKIAATNVSATKGDWIVDEYPEFNLPLTGYFARNSYLEDTSGSSGVPTYNYQNITRTANYASNCFVQRKAYSSAPSAIAAQDMNADGVVDGVLGFKYENSNQGKGVISYAGSVGNGMIADTNFTNGTSANSSAGFSVAAASWKFIDNSGRRDFMLGAPNFASGAGAIINFNAGGTNVVSTVPIATLQEDANAPNRLNFEFSRIIGDVNGDGYDDIWVPVHRVGLTGNSYNDAIIYFGSPYGPVTTTMCKARLSIFKTASGAAISSSDCEAAAGGGTAVISGSTVHLPQYISKPTGIGDDWALYAFPAGDVDHDGRSEVFVVDPNLQALYLFFGSDSGFVNGQPIFGASTNHVPQFLSKNGSVIPALGYWTPASSYSSNHSANSYSYGAYPLVHGDFNGDGFEDFVIGVGETNSPSYSGGSGHWTCSTTSTQAATWISQCGQVTPFIAPNSPGPAVGSAGAAFVFYGGPNGYQTPVNGSGQPTDFQSPAANCDDFFGNCTYPANSNQTASRDWAEIYRTLNYSSGAQEYQIDTTKTACTPSSGICKSQIIRNPIFFDDTSATGDMFINMIGTNFGTVLTVMDVNNDGIDDLVVGDPKFNHINYASAKGPAYNNDTIGGAAAADAAQKGSVMIYYGAKGAGLVAPKPQDYLADTAQGIATGTSNSDSHRTVFRIYPKAYIPGSLTYVPELDRDPSNNPLEAGRQFGVSISPGDFNGDGVDDIAVASGQGQVYVFYGPLCQLDNLPSTWQATTYLNHNKAVQTGSVAATDCTTFNLNKTFADSTANQSVTQNQAVSSKPLYPQMIYVSGITPLNNFASVMMSQRPKRNVASTTIISNPGNINGDPERTSDLILATASANDPNSTYLSYKNTGLGYVFFGHKLPSAGEMSSQPGLYIGNPSYNMSIFTSVQSGTNYYFYTPLLLRPHTSDSSVGSFWIYMSSVGDMNGDGRMDLVMPTQDIQDSLDGVPVVYGGGFKMFY